MDYKELIENIKRLAVGLREDDAQWCAMVCEDAATAIETLRAPNLEAAEGIYRCAGGLLKDMAQAAAKLKEEIADA